MNASTVIWGLLAVISGIFICAYGYTLLRTVMAGAGLVVGVWLGSMLTVGMDEIIRLLVSLVLAIVLAITFYALFRLGLYVMGALGGAVLGIIIAGILNVPEGTGMLALVVVAAIVGALMARAVGDLAVIAGTSLLGGYALLYGLSILFPGVLSTNNSNYITMTPFNAALLAVVVLVAIFGQLNNRRTRRVL